MTGFDATLADWQPFFAAQLGAGAALLGLLFVGLALNLDRILAFRALPLRAEISLMLLAMQIVVCSILLIPNQGPRAAGVEVLLLAGGVWLATTRISLHIARINGPSRRGLDRRNLALLQAATLPYVAGGAMVLLEAPLALNMVAAAMILSLLKAVMDAWVLLVEIKR